MNKNAFISPVLDAPNVEELDGAIVRFTTNAYPKEQRLDAWGFALRRKSIQIETLNADALYGELSAYQSQQKVDFVCVSSTPQTLRINLSDQSDQVWLAAILDGEAAQIGRAHV